MSTESVNIANVQSEQPEAQAPVDIATQEVPFGTVTVEEEAQKVRISFTTAHILVWFSLRTKALAKKQCQRITRMNARIKQSTKRRLRTLKPKRRQNRPSFQYQLPLPKLSHFQTSTSSLRCSRQTQPRKNHPSPRARRPIRQKPKREQHSNLYEPHRGLKTQKSQRGTKAASMAPKQSPR